jgi:hypothetical protein
MDNTYPQKPEAWRSAIQTGIGLTADEGSRAYRKGEFPYGRLETWIREAYSEGFHPDFLPALLRNIRGLVAWVYGDSGEPRWPGSDDEAPDPCSPGHRMEPGAL